MENGLEFLAGVGVGSLATTFALTVAICILCDKIGDWKG